MRVLAKPRNRDTDLRTLARTRHCYIAESGLPAGTHRYVRAVAVKTVIAKSYLCADRTLSMNFDRDV